MKTAVVFLVLFVVCSAREAPKPCCTPDQWESNMSEFSGYNARRYHKDGLVIIGAKLSYDGKGKKVWVYAAGVGVRPVKVIMDYSTGNMYLIQKDKYQKDKCTVYQTKLPFRPACVPSKATYIGAAYQGAGDDKLDVNAWAVNEKGVKAVLSMTQSGCIPVGEVAFGSWRGVDFESSIGFSNFTLGIRDPSVFEPPASCKTVDENNNNFGEDYRVLDYLRMKFTA